MRTLRRCLQAALLLSALSVLGPISPAAADALIKGGEFIVRFKAGAPQRTVDSILADLQATPIRRFRRIRAEHDRLTGAVTVPQAVNRYRNHPAIDFIEPNYIVSIARSPNDPLFPQLWGLHNTGQTGGLPGADIRATDAWNITTGSTDVIVAIIDSGTDYLHPDLAGNIFSNAGEIPDNAIDDDGNGFVDDVRGWDFVNDDNDPMDDNGHGTHVSGTVGAVGNNGLGVAGVSWSVRLMPLKFLSAGGVGTTADAIAAVEYATQMGADVMSNSWGGAGFSEALRLAIQDASDAGIFFVAAAGNSASDNDLFPFYPASYDVPNVIAVASTDHFDHLSSFSSFGAASVDLAAPGTDILSTIPGGNYALLSGTSMATPHVSGILALMKARFPLATLLGLRARLLGSVDVLPSLTGVVASNGRANALGALAEPDSTPPAPIGDLAIVDAGSDFFRLRWTATGDDGSNGTAGAYEVRYSTSPLDEATFATGTLASGAPDPRPSGSPEEMEITGLAFATTHYVAIRALDELGNASPISNVVSGTTLGAPALAFNPTSISDALLTGARSSHSINLSNVGEGTLDFTIEEERGVAPVSIHDFLNVERGAVDPRAGEPVAAGAGGPDHFGYRWIDSDQAGGPAFEWVEISDVGTRIPMSTLDANFGPIPIGFPFPFYGTTFTSLRACTHGWVSFTNTSTQFSNQPLPNFGAPENLLAPFWEDLNFSGVERAFYHNDGSRFIIEYKEVPGTLVSGPFTFEIILYPNGEIVYQYLSMGSGVLGATVGIQNAARDDGLTIVFNAPYVHANLAIKIARTPEWFTVSPRSGRLFAPGTLPLDVELNAADLRGGTYSGAIRVRSNDPLRPLADIPVQLVVTGVADIDLSRAALDFGPVFVGGARSESLVVTNRGTDHLHVTEILAAPSDYEVLPLSVDLTPGTRRTVLVTFRPTAAVPVPGTLTIRSDDPDEAEVAVPLSGEGMVPPDIAVTPSSLSADLFTGGSAARTLTVQNEGASDLLFQVDLRPVVYSPPAPSATNPGMGAGEIQARYAEFRAGASGAPTPAVLPAPQAGVIPIWEQIRAALSDSVIIFHDDMEGGTNGWTHSATLPGSEDLWGLSTARSHSGATSWHVSEHSGVGGDALRSPPIDLVGFRSALLSFQHWYNFDDCSGDPEFEPDGGLVEISTDGGATWEQIYPLAGYPYILDDFCGNPLAFHAAYSHDGGVGAAFVPAVFDLTPFVNSVVALRFHAGWDCGNCGPNEGWYMDDVTVYSGAPRIVTVAPDSGTVAPGASLDLGVTFQAAGLVGGDYGIDLDVKSNDPDESGVVVPTVLHVTGAPDIAWSPASVDFGEVFLGRAVTDTVVVANAGTDVLDVTQVLTDHPEFTAAPPAFSLAPGGQQIVLATFTPSAATAVTGLLTVRSNDADEPEVAVSLHGVGLIPPDIGVDPTMFAASLQTGETATQLLTVRNTGGSDLTFGVRARRSAAGGTGHAPAAPPDSLRRPTANNTRPDVPPASVQALYQGTHLRFGVTEYGEIMPFQFPLGTEHLEVGTFLSGYTVAYVAGGVDHVAYAVQYYRPGIEPVSYQELENTPSRVVVEVVTRTQDNVLRIRRLLTFVRDRKYVRVQTEVENLSPALVTQVVFKEDVDWDVDWDFEDDGWDYDRPRNTVYAWDQHYVAVGSEQAPDVMDLYGWDDYGVRTTTVDFPSGPVQPLDGLEVLHFELGELAPSQKGTVALAYGAGTDLAELERVMDEALNAPSWLSVNPESGTVPAGGSAELAVRFDPGSLLTGDYAAQLEVESNDPDEPQIALPASLHVTGIPDMTITPSSLDFGSPFLGLNVTRTLLLANIGTDRLEVTGITADLPDYAVEPAAFALEPSQSASVTVTFSPVTAGIRNSTLTITSNDPDSPASVPLVAAALIPPDISVSPSSLSAALFSGERETRTLTIANSGGSDLTVQLSVVHAGALADSTGAAAPGAGSPGAADSRTSTSSAPVAAQAGSDSAAVLVIQDTSAWGLDMASFVAAHFGITPAVIHSSQIAGTDFSPYQLIITVGDEDFSYYGAISANVAKFESFLSLGGVVQYQLATQGSDVQIAGGAQVRYGSFENQNRVLLPGHPVVAGLPAELLGNWANHCYLTQLPPGTQIITETWSSHEPTTVEYSVGAGTVVATGMTWEFLYLNGYNSGPMLYQATAYSLSRTLPAWLTVAPATATIPAGGSLDVQVTFDATGLDGGGYDATIRIASNDPDETGVDVPAHLDVTGIPIISVTPMSLAFDPLFPGQSDSLNLVVANTGTADLDVTGISSDEDSYRANPTAFRLGPRASRDVAVVFAPTSLGMKNATLSLVHNAAGSPTEVSLSGTAVPPPILTLSPESFHVNLRPGQVRTDFLTIGNSGGSDLHFSLDPRATGATVTVNSDPPLAKGEEDRRVGNPVTQGAGGPDQFGHRWNDSDEPGGPVFGWVDIAATGVPVPIAGDDAISLPIPIGFPFRYFGTEFTTVRVCTNGFLTFTSGAPSFSNNPLPSPFAPENLLAVFWDDLDFTDSSHAYYQTDGQRFIVQFDSVYHLTGGGPYTFEAILYESGAIVYQYLSVAPPLTSATIGIQNGTRDDGLTVVFNTDYVHGNLAILLSGAPGWLTVSPKFGTLPPGGTAPIAVSFDAAGLALGDYGAGIGVSTNDPSALGRAVPVLLRVVEDSPPVVTAPEAASGAEGALLQVGVTASDPDGDSMFSLTADPLPVGAAFSANGTKTAGELQWTPDFDQAGIYAITITAASTRRATPVSSPTDLLEGSATVQISIANTDRAPVVSAPATVTVAEGIPLSFAVSAADPDGDPIASLDVGEIPVGAMYTPDPSQPAGTFTWTPDFNAAGLYHVTFTGSNALAGSTTTSITVTNVNRAPVADPGGPYTGVPGMPIQLDGSRSADPDGQPLEYAWDFGDGGTGSGATPSHTYASSAGSPYTVALFASDGALSDTATTTATLQDVFAANVFFLFNWNYLYPQILPAWVRIEPVEGSFDIHSVMLPSITMGYEGMRIVAGCKSVLDGDRNRNGAREIRACFTRNSLRTLFAGLPNGLSHVEIELEGDLLSGGRFHGTAMVYVVKLGFLDSGALASVSPNPLNPQATLTFVTTQPGIASAQLFDLHGRLVRNLMPPRSLTQGIHEVTVDGRNDQGSRLASGVYYYRVRSVDGISKGTVVILK